MKGGWSLQKGNSMFHFEVIGPVPRPSSLHWSKVDPEKSLAGGLCKNVFLLRMVQSHWCSFKCRCAVWLCLVKFEVCGCEKKSFIKLPFLHNNQILTPRPSGGILKMAWLFRKFSWTRLKVLCEKNNFKFTSQCSVWLCFCPSYSFLVVFLCEIRFLRIHKMTKWWVTRWSWCLW